MRIISGTYKSRKLVYPDTQDVRPTMDRVKESLFNVLGDRVQDTMVLDLFAGSGSLGLEALSRGARLIYFVDNDIRAIQAIRTNVATIGVTERVRVKQMHVDAAIDVLRKMQLKFDLVFLDPPYRSGLAKKTLLKLYQSAILAPNSELIVEHAPEDELPDDESFQIITSRTFGETQITLISQV